MMKRRRFLATSVALSAVTCNMPSQAQSIRKLRLDHGDIILFQGDSITDAKRDRTATRANQGLGRGYPNEIAQSLYRDHKKLELQIYNRGISGNKVPDLERRWKRDCIDIEPRILSILIGVNDMWHRLAGRYSGTPEDYRDGFAALLEATRKNLPKTTVVICEPFVLNSGTVKDNQANWFPEFATRRSYAKEVAQGADAIWVPFQKMFDEAVASGTDPSELAADGVHPTPQGHKLMARTWRKVVGI